MKNCFQRVSNIKQWLLLDLVCFPQTHSLSRCYKYYIVARLGQLTIVVFVASLPLQ